MTSLKSKPRPPATGSKKRAGYGNQPRPVKPVVNPHTGMSMPPRSSSTPVKGVTRTVTPPKPRSSAAPPKAQPQAGLGPRTRTGNLTVTSPKAAAAKAQAAAEQKARQSKVSAPKGETITRIK